MANYTPSIRQGTDWIFTVTNTDSLGVAINLTGYTIKLQIRGLLDNALVLELAIGTGITVAAPTTGVASFRVTAAQTRAIDFGNYVWGVNATSPDGVSYTWIDSKLIILQARVS